MTPPLTDHARVRMQQRGIDQEAIELVLEHGRMLFDHHGAALFHVPRAKQRKLLAVLAPTSRRRMEKALDAYLVVSTRTGAIMTVGHRSHRLWRH